MPWNKKFNNLSCAQAGWTEWVLKCKHVLGPNRWLTTLATSLWWRDEPGSQSVMVEIIGPYYFDPWPLFLVRSLGVVPEELSDNNAALKIRSPRSRSNCGQVTVQMEPSSAGMGYRGGVSGVLPMCHPLWEQYFHPTQWKVYGLEL